MPILAFFPELLIALAIVGLLVWMAIRLLQALVALMMAALLATSLSVAAGAAVLICRQGSTDAMPYAFLTAVLAFPLNLYVIARRGRRQSLTSAEVPVAAAEPVPDTRPNDPIDAAWWDAMHIAPAHARRIAAARRDCDSVLERAASQPLDWSLTDCAAMIRRNLPELVQSAAEARAEEGQEVAAELVDALEDMAAEARQCLHSAGGRAGQRFAVLRAHLANRRRAAGA